MATTQAAIQYLQKYLRLETIEPNKADSRYQDAELTRRELVGQRAIKREELAAFRAQSPMPYMRNGINRGRNRIHAGG